MSNMPRVSKKAKAESCLSSLFAFRMKVKAIRMLVDSDDDSVEDMKDLAAAVCLSELRKRRYFQRSTKYRKSPATQRFKTDLHDGNASDSNSISSEEMPWLTDDEFLQKFRVTRFGFDKILQRIKDNEIFTSKIRRMARRNIN